ncbi:hypothetical protein HWV62_24540 [Athelia sp. TMB]|nr:hypothetical protein HWV62_24540 [Athelia sp. TMB]
MAAPAGSFTRTSTSARSSPTVPYASNNPNFPLWSPQADPKIAPAPIRGPLGGKILGPQNIPLQMENPDALAAPSTDAGNVPNFKWPFSLSHTSIWNGGWTRQQNSVNMMLKPGAIREMHWHTNAEWAYMLKGDIRITTIGPEGDTYLGDVTEGDLWYFPPGHGHSIQALNTTEDGAEFLLVFDSGTFSEFNTFQLTDWLAHVPKEVIAKNFQMDISAFNHIPEHELYIFPSAPPAENPEDAMVVSNNSPMPYTWNFSKVNATQLSGGSIKIADTRTFKVSETISVAEITVKPGAMRELHWHPTEAEWTYFISGNARVTSFAGQASAQTFDFQGGDISYIPPSFGHYIENTGNTTLRFLEIFKSGLVQDISLSQWLALTPPSLVKAHLGVSYETISKFSKTKPVVVG